MALKIIIDTDPGQDDAVAILLALASPELEVLGLTCVAGNVPLALTTTEINQTGSLGLFDVSAPQTPFFPDSLGRDQMLGLEIPGQEGLEVFDSGRGR